MYQHTDFFSPYSTGKTGKRKANISTEKKAGAYVIRSKKTKEVIYIGFSGSDLYKTILRHFETWNDKHQQRYVYQPGSYDIMIIYAPAKDAALLEKKLINQLEPRDNRQKYIDYLTEDEEAKTEKIINNSEETEAPF